MSALSNSAGHPLTDGDVDPVGLFANLNAVFKGDVPAGFDAEHASGRIAPAPEGAVDANAAAMISDHLRRNRARPMSQRYLSPSGPRLLGAVSSGTPKFVLRGDDADPALPRENAQELVTGKLKLARRENGSDHFEALLAQAGEVVLGPVERSPRAVLGCASIVPSGGDDRFVVVHIEGLYKSRAPDFALFGQRANVEVVGFDFRRRRKAFRFNLATVCSIAWDVDGQCAAGIIAAAAKAAVGENHAGDANRRRHIHDFVFSWSKRGSTCGGHDAAGLPEHWRAVEANLAPAEGFAAGERAAIAPAVLQAIDGDVVFGGTDDGNAGFCVRLFVRDERFRNEARAAALDLFVDGGTGVVTAANIVGVVVQRLLLLVRGRSAARLKFDADFSPLVLDKAAANSSPAEAKASVREEFREESKPTRSVVIVGFDGEGDPLFKREHSEALTGLVLPTPIGKADDAKESTVRNGEVLGAGESNEGPRRRGIAACEERAA